jgi:hypothetical protein
MQQVDNAKRVPPGSQDLKWFPPLKRSPRKGYPPYATSIEP